jgi:integrase
VVQVRRSVVRGQERDGTKTESGIRDVKLLPLALAALAAQKDFTYGAGGTIFHNPRHNAPWTGPRALAKGPWTVVLRHAKVRYRNLYQTRHTYASLLLTAGEDPMWVAQQMGHKDWGMIRKIYGRWIPEMRPEAGNRAAAALG